MSYQEYLSEINEAKAELSKNGGRFQIIWIKGRGLFDKKIFTVPNKYLTEEEKNILRECEDNPSKIKENIAFFLLRLYYNHFINFESYKVSWLHYHPDKPIDQTKESFKNNLGKWNKSEHFESVVLTAGFTIPYDPSLIIN